MTTTMTTTRPTTTDTTGPVDPIGTDLTPILRTLKLGGLGATLPERLALARQHKMGHAAFLELLLSDEVTPARVPLGDVARQSRQTGPGHAHRHLRRTRRPAL